MKRCQKCNLDFPDSFNFCGSCGADLPDTHTCEHCGELVDSKWAFCTGCGNDLSSNRTLGRTVQREIPDAVAISSADSHQQQTSMMQGAQKQTNRVPLDEWYAASDLLDETTEVTVTSPPAQSYTHPITELHRVTPPPQNGNGKAAPTLTMLSAYGQTEETATPESRGWPQALVGALALAFFVVIGFGIVYWWTHRAAGAQTAPSAEQTVVPAADSSASTSTATGSSPAIATANSADDEWKHLREKRIAANSSESANLIKLLQEAEQKYPRDYRFPYERAKLSIKGITSHDEAFDALSLAADKAIDNGKSQEMLDNLNADKDGDFYKLARGHHEWQALLDALENRDKKELTHLHHNG